MVSRPRVFVGSSTEGKKYAYGVQKNLWKDAEVTVWDQNVFAIGKNNLEALFAQLDNSDFAIFIFSHDDVTLIRDQPYAVARDNVVFELGLFMGRLNRERTFFLVPTDHQDLRILTDLAGITPGEFEHDRRDSNWQAATAPACDDIGNALKKFVPAEKPSQAEILDNILEQLRTLLSKQLITEYAGIFPSYVEKHICPFLERAEKEITIACDVFTYGAFSRPAVFKKYIDLLEAKQAEGVKVRFLILNSEIREEQDRQQLPECRTDEGFRGLIKKDPAFASHVAFLGTKTFSAITNADDFFKALTKFELQEIRKRKDKFEFAVSSLFFPIYFWITDASRAVFAIPRYNDDGLDHGFTTEDVKLVSCLNLIWDRYKVNSKSIEMIEE